MMDLCIDARTVMTTDDLLSLAAGQIPPSNCKSSNRKNSSVTDYFCEVNISDSFAYDACSQVSQESEKGGQQTLGGEGPGRLPRDISAPIASQPSIPCDISSKPQQPALQDRHQDRRRDGTTKSEKGL